MLKDETVTFGIAPELSGRWREPPHPTGVVVFSHPHTLFGGSMSSAVVRLGCHEFSELGWASLRYDFRGAGESEGEFDSGQGEQEDLRAAVAFSKWQFMEYDAPEPEIDLPVVVIGYSFGSYVTWEALENVGNIDAGVLISPPFGMTDYPWTKRTKPLDFPVHIFTGDKDHIAPKALFVKEAERIAPQVGYEVIEGVDHFWGGMERELTRKINLWLKDVL